MVSVWTMDIVVKKILLNLKNKCLQKILMHNTAVTVISELHIAATNDCRCTSRMLFMSRHETLI